MSEHRHQTASRGAKVVPRPKPDNPVYTLINYAYAGKEGHVHEIVRIGEKELVKVGFADRKIVYYLFEDLEW